MRGVTRGLCALVLAVAPGCGALAPLRGTPCAAAATGCAITIQPAYRVATLAHRWEAGDVCRYDTTLRVWDGAAYRDLDPPVRVVLPRTDTATPGVRFTSLKPGRRYQATVLAMGNVGGSAPECVLNSQSPGRAVFDFTAAQALESTPTATVAIALDAVPFAASVKLVPQGAPAGTTDFEVSLDDMDTGAVRVAGIYSADRVMTLSNLRVGVRYQVRLTAKAAGTEAGTASSPLYFSPTAQDLEQAQSLALVF
jgi:hypothetical protein